MPDYELHLPEALDPKFVDEYLDETFSFSQYHHSIALPGDGFRTDVTRYTAHYRDNATRNATRNHPRNIFDLLNDHPYSEFKAVYSPDSDGYVFWARCESNLLSLDPNPLFNPDPDPEDAEYYDLPDSFYL